MTASRRHAGRWSAISVAGATLLASLTQALPASAHSHQHTPSPATPSSCQLAHGITHVINVQFDNVHLRRDNPNIASDLEQMPALKNFIEHNGVMMSNTHDVLVHTATNFMSNQTGLYPDRHAVTQSNSFSYYDASGATHPGVSFSYWTDPVVDAKGDSIDTRHNLDYWPDRSQPAPTQSINTPAPWTTYTEAGCNVGEVGMSNTVLENVTSDVNTVFGADSPQAAAAKADPTKAQADIVGLAVHCAKGSATCATGRPDVLPDEPGGYSGYQALFGNAAIQPVISPSGPVKATDGAVVADAKGNPGFPGFDSLTAANSLGYAAQLLEHGVPVTQVYLSDVHGDHTAAATGDLGPGTKTYEDQLAAYNTAFQTFFDRLAADGITPANTLFTFSTDEGDHFDGSAPTPANCDGTPGNYCTYAKQGEVNVNLNGLMATQANNTTPFAIHSDPAPAIWLTGNPAPDSQVARQFGRDLGTLTGVDPYTGSTDTVAQLIADPVEEKILHFVSADPARTPSFTAYSNEDFYVTGGPTNCASPCVAIGSPRYAWNHGGLWPDMQDIWSGYVGPGVAARGTDSTTWTDQVDMRPTTQALAGLHSSYVGDGRVLTEIMSRRALAPQVKAHLSDVERLGALDKQLLAVEGRFGIATLKASTRAVTSGRAGDDRTYTRIESRLQSLGHQRDVLTNRINQLLQAANLDGGRLDRRELQSLTLQGQVLLFQAEHLH